MSDWKEAANYRRDVRHGLLNAQDEQPRIPRGKRHTGKPFEVIHCLRLSSLEASRISGLDSLLNRDWTIRKRFPTEAKAREYVAVMNRKDANEQASRGVHPQDVIPRYYLASNEDHIRDAA